MALKIGTRVFHTGHGQGTVVGRNPSHGGYAAEHPEMVAEAVAQLPAEQRGVLAGGFMSAVYSGDRFPNVVQFDSGYRDVYADHEVERVK